MENEEQIVESFYARLIAKQIELSTVAGGALIDSKMGFTTYGKSTKYGYPLPIVDVKGIALITILPDTIAVETYGPRNETLRIKNDYHRIMENNALIGFTPSYSQEITKHLFAFPFYTKATDIQRFLMILKEKGFTTLKSK